MYFRRAKPFNNYSFNKVTVFRPDTRPIFPLFLLSGGICAEGCSNYKYNPQKRLKTAYKLVLRANTH